MKSISTALLATAAGLFVAIPVVMANNYFTKNVKIIMHNLEIISMEFMASMAHKKSLE
jgi:biopolymer transport protein ExbB